MSYYASDGIYGGEVAVSKQVQKTKTYENGIYYKIISATLLMITPLWIILKTMPTPT